MSKDLIVADRLEWRIAPPLPESLPAVREEVMPIESGSHRRSRLPDNTNPSIESKPQPSNLLAGAVNRLLSDAADYFEQGASWCQNAMGNDAQVCAVGALLRMELGDKDNVYNETQPYRHPLTSAAVKKLAKHLNETRTIPRFNKRKFDDQNFGVVSSWNDASGRTKTEVIDLFREVSK